MAQTKKPLSSRMFRLVAGLVFCWMLLLNCLTPYLADDYTFAYTFDTGERLHSLPQLISSLVFHYHEWSGRVIVKFFAQGFTMFPKLLFNVCNAGMFMALGLVLYKLAVGRRSQKADWLALALIYAALWEISPVFGQTNLWMCGACNYLCKPADADDVLAALLSEHADLDTLVPENPMSVDRLQWEHIQRVLTEHEGNISATARALGMHRRTLQRKLQKRPVRR